MIDQASLVLHARVVRGAGGGPDKTILNSPRYLAKVGYPMICAYLRHPADRGFAELERRAHRWGARLVPVDDLGPFDWRVVGRLRELCLEWQPSIWHGHDYKSNLLGLLLRKSCPMRLVTTVHGWVHRTWKTPLYYALDRLCLRHYDAVICVSQDLYELAKKYGVPPSRCWLVHNAVDTAEFRRTEGSEVAKANLGVTPGRFLIGAVGRLSDEKGFQFLILALERLVASGLDLELWIAGDGDRRTSLERLASDLKLGNRVKLYGFRPDMTDFYQALDLFVLSSVREGLPNALLEAMAVELPVICTRVGGIPALVQHGVNGLLVEPASVDAIAGGVRRLVEEPECRRRLGTAGRACIERSYSLPTRMDKVKGIYEQLLYDDRRSQERTVG